MPALRSLGVNCSSDSAFLAIVEGGQLIDAGIEKVDGRMIADSGEQLVAVLGELRRIIAQVRPDTMVLLNPEQSPRAKRTHSAYVPRIALETLVRLAAAQTGCPLEVLARPTLRKRLDIPMKGSLAEHAARLLPGKSGKNWSGERQLAAIAAMAGES